MANELKFGKGIGVAAGFDLGAQKPLDSRYTVADIEERDAHVTGNRAYEGMLVFVEADKKTYQYLDGAWVEFGFNNDKLEAEIVDNLESDEATKILSAKQGKVLKGLIDAEAETARAAEEANANAIEAIANDYLKAEHKEALEGAIAEVAEDLSELAGTHATDKAALEGAIALKADKETFEQAVEDLEAEDERIEGLVTAEAGRAAGEEARIEGLVTAEAGRAAGEEARIEGLVTAEVNRATGIETGLRTDVDAIKADYLKAADKTELQGNIDTLTDVVETLRDGIDADKVDGILDLIKYVEDHGTEVTGMKEDIAENAKAIEDHVADYEAHLLAQTAIDEAQDAKIEALENKFKGEGSVEDLIEDAQAAAEAKAAELATAAKDAAIAAAATDATTKANAAEAAAKAHAEEKATAAENNAKAHAEEKATAAQSAAEAKAKELADAAQAAAEAKAEELAGAVEELADAAQAAADKAQGDVNALTERVTTVEGEIDTLQSEMDAVEAKADANEEAIAKLNGAANVEGSVANLISIAKAEAATDAQTKANAAEKNAKDYIDEKVTDLINNDTAQEQEIAAILAQLGTGKVQDRIDGALVTAATDATNKANKALEDAKTHVAEEIAKLDGAVTVSSNRHVLTGVTETDGKLTDKTEVELSNIAFTGTTDDLMQGTQVLVFDCGSSVL